MVDGNSTCYVEYKLYAKDPTDQTWYSWELEKENLYAEKGKKISSTASLDWSGIAGYYENLMYTENDNDSYEENLYHYVWITEIGPNVYKWSNHAGVEWTFEATTDDDVYVVSEDNVYASYGFDESITTRDDRGQILTITGPF